MTKHYFKAILISLLAVAAWSQTAVAQTPPLLPYGNCGDGVIEVNPYAGADVGTPTDASWNSRLWNSPWEVATEYAAPRAYFYRGSTADGFSPQTPWPTAAGEMCDDGPNSPVFCKKDSCTIFNYVIPGSVDKTKFLNDSISECYSSNKCAPGIGNGIIQPGTRNIPDPSSPSSSITIEFNEECDDGNITAGDGCSPLGKIELAEKYVSDVCGNGIVDGDDVCDDGNIRDGDGCSSDCKSIGLSQVCKGTVPQRGTGDDQKLCGNGRVDYALGEQCDEGKDKNGMPDSSCRVNCVLRSSPQFSLNKIAFWKSDIPNIKMDVSDEAKADKTVNDAWPIPADGNDTSKYKVENKNQKVAISYAKDQQLSGVFLTDQSISELKEGSKIFKDGKIHLKMVFSPTEDGSVHIWDDDAFGIVFGIKEGDQSKYEALGDSYKYLMLSWRSYQPASWTRAYVRPGCNDERQSHYGPTGLRLYQITGVPNYIQLWTMQGCRTNPPSNANIEEIATNNIDDWEFVYNSDNPPKKLYPKKPGENSWNKVINPFLPLNTFYAVNFGYGQSAGKQRLQIDVEFSKEELKVWVNRVLAIHIIRKNSPIADSWPTEGQLGFYFLGMDNLTVDTSGYYSYVEDTSTVDSASDSQSTTCSNYCGNGIIENDDPSVYSEECDDGNTVDGDGCSSTCKSEGESENCKAAVPNGAVLCYGGSITNPQDGSTITAKPSTIRGTYVGDSYDRVFVQVYDKNGVLVEGCEGDATLTESPKTWEFRTSGCTLKDGEKYTTKASFLAGVQSPKGENFPPIIKESTFTIDSSQPYFDLDAPASETVAIPNNTKNIPFSGNASDDIADVKLEICEEAANPPSCKDVSAILNSGQWSYDMGSTDLSDGKKYIVTVTAETSSNASLNNFYKRTVIVGNYLNLDKPEFTNLANDKIVIPNSDGTITVQGEERIPVGCKTSEGKLDHNKCPQIYVTLKGGCSGSKESIRVPINDDGTFSADVPVCGNPGDRVTITAKASDDSGLESPEPPTSVTVNLKEKATPKIIITCPKPTSAGDECPLPGGGSSNGLVVNGETNVRSQRKVTVKAYEAKEDGTCDFSAIAEGNVAPLDSKVVNTTLEGNWTADFKHFQTGTYCIVAELNVDGKPKTTTIAKKYDRKSNIDRNNQDDKPVFVDSPTALASKILKAGTDADATIKVTVKVPDASNVAIGDECSIAVDNKESWPDTPVTGTFKMSETGELLCSADIKVNNGSGDSLLGNTLTAKVGQKGKSTSNYAEATPQPIPGATITQQDGKATITVDETFPGASNGETVNFRDKTGKVVGTCLLKPATQPKKFECTSDDILKDGTLPLIHKNSDTEITATLGKDDAPTDAEATVQGHATTPGTPKDGTDLFGDSGIKGTLVYNENQTATIRVSKGQPGEEIFVTVTSKDGSTKETKSCWVQLDMTCTTDVFTILPADVKTAVAKDGDGTDAKTIDTWFPKTDAPDKDVQVTARYQGDDTNNSDDNKLVVTVPKEGLNVPAPNVGDTLKVAIGGETVDCVVNKTRNGYIQCVTTKPFVKTDNSRYGTSDKITVSTSGAAPEKIGTAYVQPGIAGPKLTIEDGKGKFSVSAEYPGLEKGDKVSFKDATNQKEVGSCTLEKVGDNLECTSTDVLKEGEVPLTNLNGATKVVASAEDTTTNIETVSGTNVPTDGTPEDGTNFFGDSDIKGTLVYNNNKTATITVTEGQPGDEIVVTVTSKDGTAEETKSCWVQSDMTCTTEVFTIAPDNVKTAVAKDSKDDSAKTIDTWFPKTNTPDKTVQPTVTYVNKSDKHVVITIPKDGSGLNDGDTVKVTDESGQAAQCNVRQRDDYFECVSEGPFVKSDGTRFSDTDGPVEVSKVDGGSKTPVGTAYVDSSDKTATITAESDGKATIFIPEGYPGFVENDPIVFKNDQGQEVGRCNLEPVTDGLGCTSTEPLKEGDDKLIDKPKGQNTQIVASGNGVDLANGSIDGTKVPPEPTMSIDDSNGSVTVNIPAGHPVTLDEKITFKQGETEVGSCPVQKDGENWICTGKLNDKATKGEVTAVLGGKDVAKANYTPADSGQGGDNNPSGAYTEKGNQVIVKLPPEVVRKNHLEVGQKLTILGPDKKQQIGDPCTISKEENGNLICIVDNLKSPVPAGEKLYAQKGEGIDKIAIPLTPEAVGFVAGGCSTTDSPESGLLALLFAALGFFGIRRRRD